MPELSSCASSRRRPRQASLMAAGGDGPVIFRFPVLMLATWWDEPGGQTAPQFQPGSDTH